MLTKLPRNKTIYLAPGDTLRIYANLHGLIKWPIETIVATEYMEYTYAE